MSEAFDDVIKEYIDFINLQVGAYLDGLSGFSGNQVRVERQVARINRPVGTQKDKNGQMIIVHASFEDPTRPDIIIHRIVKAVDFIATNSIGGSNEQQFAQAIIIFLFTYWEDEVRPRLAVCKRMDINQIKSDVIGDLRIVRNVILHSKGVIRHDKHSDLKVLKELFVVNEPIQLSTEKMHRIFVLLKQECAKMLYEWLGVKDPSGLASQMVDVAIQKRK